MWSADPAPLAPSHAGGVDRAVTVAAARAKGWTGVRLGLLALATLFACLGLLWLANTLAETPRLDAHWQLTAQGQIELAASDLEALKPHRGKVLTGLGGMGMASPPLDALAVQRSARWLTDEASRLRHRQTHEQLADALAAPSIGLRFADGSVVDVPTQRLGFDRLGPTFWVLAALALALGLAAVAVVLVSPSERNLVYGAISLCQVGNLVFLAVASVHELGLPRPFLAWDMPVRMALDLLTAAAAVHAASLYRQGSAVARRIAIGAWTIAGATVLWAALVRWSHAWWWAEAGIGALCAVAIGLLCWPYRSEPHPLAIQLRRVGIVTLGAGLLVSFSLIVADRLPGPQHPLIVGVSIAWYVVFALLLLLVPFLSRSQQILRELSLLAAIAALAASLELLFVTSFSMGPFVALTLSLFLALSVYSGARHWMVGQLPGRGLTTERMFEQLYRIAREVEAHPHRVPALLLRLLQDLFEPMQADLVDDAPASVQIADDGSTLLVPLPALAGGLDAPAGAIRVRFAQRGRRLFTSEDALLTDRIVEQLRRAVAFDQAVEQGRREERLRLAQDLHDDIGARLLTLMYKAQSPEMEEYVRHTLKDLKTLTRGLAAPSHRLSHAAAEWKADLTQRLTAADVVLGWSCSFDRDILLSVVQWSALTRILRELVSNAIAHANARRVDVAFQLEGTRLDLSVTDNGGGRDPRSWSHGLGLGGVRKRVKQLGGDVEWREAEPSGIDCRVQVVLQAPAE